MPVSFFAKEIWFLLIGCVAAPVFALANPYPKGAELRGLNKITARTSIFIAEKEQPMQFGNLEITVRECWKAPPEEKPEAKALLEIWEQRPNEKKHRIFHGWMFQSSPALNALEHPVYDVILLDCKN